jgi:hypothetical protein
MVFLLVFSAWILMSLVVGGLCVAAQMGDRQQRHGRPAQPGWELPESAVVACWSAEELTGPVEFGGAVARTAA